MEDLLESVTRHPRVAELGRNALEQQRVEDFALDLARYLYGHPRESLRPLARVVTLVAGREFRDPRRLCRQRPLLAVESAARATEALWPFLRGDLEEPDEAPEPPEPSPPSQEPGMASEDAEQGSEGANVGESAETDEDEPVPAEDEEVPAEDDESGDGTAEEQAESAESPTPSEGGQSAEAPAFVTELDDLPEDMQDLAEALRALMDQAEHPEQPVASAAKQLEQAGEAALEAALETSDVVSKLESFVPGIGWSTAPGALTESLLQRLDALASLLDDLEGLRALADRLGRIEDAEPSERGRQGGSEEVAGVRLSGDVSRALPGELALLSDPDTEDLFYQRMLEHRLVSLELSGAGWDGRGEGTSRGPVIACIDTSGSMQGVPELAAKALVLALARKVLPQGRVVHLILFGGPDDRQEIRLKRGRGGLEQLLDFLAMSFHAGTDFDAPLVRAMALLQEQELERSDVLVVTDGLARATSEVIARVQEVKAQMGARIYSVVFGHGDVRGVEPFSDEVLSLDPHDSERALALVRKVSGRRGRRG